MNRKFEIPFDEESRLAALRVLGLVDTAPEDRFDRITRLAARLFAVPVVLMVLVDEQRIWIKSASGFASGIAISPNQCFTDIIAQDDILQFTDLIVDRGSGSELHNEPALPRRYYAGCPLRTREGYRVGALCLFDQAPHSLGSDALQSLQDLAGIIESELGMLEQASQDALTGIPNKRGFALLAQQNLAFCARNHCAGSLVLLDLEGLKAINDKHGRNEGDLALLVLADMLKKAFRGSDSFARLGGDQFAVFLTNVTRLQAEVVFARFADALLQYNREASRDYQLGYTRVIVEFSPDHDTTLVQLLLLAEAELYRIKMSCAVR